MKRKLISFTLSVIMVAQCFLTGCASVESNFITNVYASENVDSGIVADDESNESSVNIADQDLSAVVLEFSDAENNSEEDHVHSYVYYVQSNDEHIGYCECGDEITEAHLFDGLVCSLCGYETEELIDKSKVTSVIVTTNAPSSYLFKKEINLWISAYTVVSGDNQYSLILVSNQNAIDFTGEEFYGFFSDLKNCSQIVFEEGNYYFDSNSFDFTGLGSNAGFPAELDFVDANIYLNTDSDYYAFSGANIKTVYLPAILSSNGRVLLGESFAGYDEELKQVGEYSYIIPSYQEGSVVMLSNDPSYQVALLDNTDEVIWTDPDNGTVYKKSEAIEIVDLSNSGSNNIICYGFDTDSNSIGDLYVVTSTNANNILKHAENQFGYPWSKRDSSSIKNSSNAKKVVFRDKLKAATSLMNTFYHCSSLTDIINFNNVDTSNVTDMSQLFCGCSSLVNVDVSSMNTSNVTSFNRMFAGCSKLKKADVSNFDTSNVTGKDDMHNMFYQCSSLTELDVSNFDTSKVTDMYGMFYQCSSLTKLDVSNFDTSNVTDMQSMFSGCSSLKILDLKNFNTSKVKFMYGMFRDCKALIELDVSSFDTSNVTTMDSMFGYCSSLTKLDLSNFNTSNVTNISNMFQNCSALTELNISSFDLSKVTESDNFITGDTSLIKIWIPTTFGSCPKITLPNKMYAYDRNDNQYGIKIYSTLLGKDKIRGISYLKKENILIWTDPDNGKEYWSDDALQIDNQLDVNKSGTILGYQFDSDANNTADLYVVLSESPDEVLGSSLYSSSTGDSEFFETKAKNMTRVVFKNALKSSEVCSYFYNFAKLTSIIGLENLNTENATTMRSMFYSCPKLTDLNLSQLNTKNVTDMSMMFYNCSKLTELDISHFDTSNVIDMDDMFGSCESLAKLNISNIDTSNVTNMEEMFRFCRSLKILDLSNFNTSKVTDMRYMFYNCSKLTELNVSSFDTSNVTDMSYMFATCSSLTELDVSSFDTSNVTRMNNMFAGLHLAELDLSNFNTSKVTTMDQMFYFNYAQKIDVSSFDTSKVIYMRSMFYNCSSLTELDVSNFSTSKVTDMYGMFYQCSSLTKLDVSNFDTSKVKDMYGMFAYCSGLMKLDLSNFNTNNVTSMKFMFYCCRKITELDLSSFDMSKVTNIDTFLIGMNSLEKIYIPSNTNGLNIKLPSENYYGYKADGSIIDRDFTYTTLPSKDETTGLSFISSKKLLYNSFVIAVPANINMDLYVGEGAPYYQGNGNVNIEYNMLQNKNISISPAESFSLKNDDQSRSLTASVTLDKKITNFNNDTEGSVKKTSDIDKSIFGDLSETYTNTMPFTIVAPANKVADNYTGSLGFTIATVPAA